MFNFFTLPVFPVEQSQISFYQVPQSVLCSCVNTSKYILGKQDSGPWGNARDIKPNSDIPTIGGIVITNEGGGHIGIIVSKSGEFITIREGNYEPCRLTERTIRIDNEKILGFKS